MLQARYLDEYDYTRPRTLLELTPVTTMEVKPAKGEPFFPLKERYDRYRNVPTAMLPHCILKSSETLECDEFPDKEDSEDASVPGGLAGEAAEDEMMDPFAELPEGVETMPKAAGGEAEEEDMGYHYRQDAIGRHWLYDKYGNRVYKKPLRGSLRPRSIPQKAWNKIPKETRKEISDFYHELQAKKGLAPKSTSTSAAAASASKTKSSCNLQSILLLLTCLGTLADGATEHTHVQEAIQTCLAGLLADKVNARSAAAAAPVNDDHVQVGSSKG